MILGISLLFVGCDSVTDSNLNNQTDQISESKLKGGPDKNPVQGSDTILEIAASNEDFSILARAVTFAELGEALDGNRQLTVFAPDNEAFVALLNQLGLTAEELFTEGNKKLVTNILLYHVAPGKRISKSLVNAKKVNTLLKKFADLKREEGNLLIGNNENGFATVTATDIRASNGVIHAIDSVLLPPSSE